MMFLKVVVCFIKSDGHIFLENSQETEQEDMEWNATHAMHHQGEGDRANGYQLHSMTFVRIETFPRKDAGSLVLAWNCRQ